MAKLACLMPNMEMIELARKIIDETGMKNVVMLENTPTGRAEEYARGAVARGAEIIVARGLQASQIKAITSVPVVELRMTGQEMGLLITQAKKILDVARPTIGVVGYANMFCDMRYFEEIFNVSIRQYYVTDPKDGHDILWEQARRAVNDKVDLVIGGEVAVEVAREAGVPALFTTATEDSIREGILAARQVAYASDLEKANTAELKTLLDNSFGVVAKLDPGGCIEIVNHVAESLLNWKRKNVTGIRLTRLVREIDDAALDGVLREGREIYSVFLSINKVSLVANLAPIKAGGEITGAIFSCQEVKRLEEMGVTARRELYQQGYVAKCNFSNLESPSAQTAQALTLGKLYAQSDAPVLLLGEPGCAQEQFAQSIHNASIRRHGPYVSAGCEEAEGETQLELLFGRADREQPQRSVKGLIATAHGGTLFLHGLERLEPAGQYRLLRLLQGGVLISGGEQKPLPVDVRVIASAGRDLPALVEQGRFDRELFFAVNNLLLELAPLRERPEDILFQAEQSVKLLGERYKRYVTLTAGARELLAKLDWPGNGVQLRSFFERLVLTAPRRSVDETYISALYYQMYPLTRSPRTQKPLVIYKDPEAALIADLLEKHEGRRSAVAEELGISTTTLWRKMKKYRIEGKYGV